MSSCARWKIWWNHPSMQALLLRGPQDMLREGSIVLYRWGHLYSRYASLHFYYRAGTRGCVAVVWNNSLNGAQQLKSVSSSNECSRWQKQICRVFRLAASLSKLWLVYWYCVAMALTNEIAEAILLPLFSYTTGSESMVKWRTKWTLQQVYTFEWFIFAFWLLIKRRLWILLCIMAKKKSLVSSKGKPGKNSKQKKSKKGGKTSGNHQQKFRRKKGRHEEADEFDEVLSIFTL